MRPVARCVSPCLDLGEAGDAVADFGSPARPLNTLGTVARRRVIKGVQDDPGP
jgi:hypothetical protein